MICVIISCSFSFQYSSEVIFILIRVRINLNTHAKYVPSKIIYDCLFLTAIAASYQVYPLGYAYHHDSVNRAERASANCRRYMDGLKPGTNTSKFIHCDGTQLRLNDSDLGSEQYSSSVYYVWPARKTGQLLLFIFPTRVSLTTIILHYYNDSDRGLPRLRFYAVPDDFDVWDAPTTGITNVDVAAVPPGGKPVGRRNISINVNFNTKKVLMNKYKSNYLFAVSEVKFFSKLAIS